MRSIEGQTWFLVATRWYNQWEEYVQLNSLRRGEPGPHPGPIDNSPILAVDGSLMPYARERTDFVIRSEAIWNKLLSLYGGGPAIPRKVVSNGWSKSVETHPFKLMFLKSSDPATIVTGYFSKGAKIKEVRNTMCERMHLNVDDVRMWDYHNDQKLKILEDPLCTLAEERILDNQKLLFEERQPDGKWPKLATKREREFDMRSQERVEPGLCGLNNLGNTCFMNSGLQCLSNTGPLCELMVSGKCDAQINRTNALGTKGELTTEFSELLQDMWSGRMSSVAPRDFKWKLERFAPQFSGWQQHDSHELLAFLLDGLHEDLNRVTKKPYFETNEFEGMPEAEAAAKSWAQHIARNDSFITDNCHGLLRSEVNCNVCTRRSKVFDPFMYLSVPLPEAKTRGVSAIVWSNDLNKVPTKYMVEVPKFGTVQDFVEEVAKVSGIDAKKVHVCDVYSQRFFKQYKREEPISSITDRDVIFCFETGVGPQGPDKSLLDSSDGATASYDVDVVVLFKAEEKSTGYYGASTHRIGLDPPVFVTLPVKATYKEFYDMLCVRFARFFAPKKAEEGETAVAAADAEEDSLRLFKFVLTDRYGQAVPGQDNLADDCVITLVHGCTLLVVLDSAGSRVGVFDRKGATNVVLDASMTAAESGEGETGMSLSQCISLFGEKEQLSEEDPWYCSQCKEHRRAFKKFDLWKLPKILIVQLKRFSYRNKHWREKIETLVQFPLEGLDLTEHVRGPITPGEEPIYDLYAISNHYGALGGGHYTAFAINPNLRKWFKFDDSSVAEVHDPRSVITPAAYILFYQRRDSRMPPGTRISTPAKYLAMETAAQQQAASGAGKEELADDDEDDEEEERSSVLSSAGNLNASGAGLSSSNDYDGLQVTVNRSSDLE